MLDPDLIAFVRLNLPSNWTLEVLLLLRRRALETLSIQTMVLALRATSNLVERCLEQLREAGLVVLSDGGARFSPMTAELAELCERLERASLERPIALRDAISASHDETVLQQFADAFRFKKDKDE